MVTVCRSGSRSKVSARANSFQAATKATSPVTAMAGSASGRKMETMARKRVQPSIQAASSMAAGMAAKYDDSIQTENAI